LSVGGLLLIHDHTTIGGDVTLRGAKIGNSVEMIRSTFAGLVTAENVTVEGNLLMNEVTFASAVDVAHAKIGGVLSLQGAVASVVYLSGATAGELLIGHMDWRCTGGRAFSGVVNGTPGADAPPVHWPLGYQAWRNTRCGGAEASTLPTLILRNTHVDAFQDSAADAWPPSIDLEGFHYDRLGGINGYGRDDMRRRLPNEWTDWLAREQTFSNQPYAQLATVLLVAGRRDTAEKIQFAGRERERSQALADGDYETWAWLTFLSSVAGYGIGLYTFRVLWWVSGLTVLGGVVLLYSPNARARWYPPHKRPFGIFCLLAASLHRLLPVVRLSREFEEFFDNLPVNPPNLKPWQVAYFAGHALFGWALGLILLAAMSGLTQKG
jgi:hypothetical protein